MLSSSLVNFISNIRHRVISSKIISSYDIKIYHMKNNQIFYCINNKNNKQDLFHIGDKIYKRLILQPNKTITINNDNNITLLCNNYKKDLIMEYEFHNKYYKYNKFYNHIKNTYLSININKKINIKLSSNKEIILLISKN